jgi:hypothetical protein
MTTREKLTTMIMHEYNKHSGLFEDYPMEIVESINCITITKILLKNQMNRVVLSLFVSWRKFSDDFYFDDSEVYVLSYNWENSSYNSLQDVSVAMKNEYITNKKIIDLSY